MSQSPHVHPHVHHGGCLGAIGAAVISYAINGSAGWAVFHFFCSWIYILYAAFARTKEILPGLSKMFGAGA